MPAPKKHGMIPNMITLAIVFFRVDALPILCPSEELREIGQLDCDRRWRPTSLLEQRSRWPHAIQRHLTVIHSVAAPEGSRGYAGHVDRSYIRAATNATAKLRLADDRGREDGQRQSFRSGLGNDTSSMSASIPRVDIGATDDVCLLSARDGHTSHNQEVSANAGGGHGHILTVVILFAYGVPVH